MEKTIDVEALALLIERCAETGEDTGLRDYNGAARPVLRTFLDAISRYRAAGATPQLLRLVAHLVTMQSDSAFGLARAALSLGDSRMSELFSIMEGILGREGKASPAWRTMALLCTRLAALGASQVADACQAPGPPQGSSLVELLKVACCCDHPLVLENPALLETPEDESSTDPLVLLGHCCFAADHLERAWACYDRRLPLISQRRFDEFSQRALAQGHAALAAKAAAHIHGADRAEQLRTILTRAVALGLTNDVQEICERYATVYFTDGELLEAGTYLGARAPWRSLRVLALARVSDHVLMYERLIVQRAEEAYAALVSLPPPADGYPLGEAEQAALLTHFGDDALDRGDLPLAHACYRAAGATQNLSALRLHAEAIGAKALERLIFSSIGELIAAHGPSSQDAETTEALST